MMCELLYSISCVSVSARHAEDMQSITKYCYEHHWTVLKFRSILTPLYWCYIKILFFFSSEFYVVYYYLIFGSVTSQKGLIICLFKHFKNGNHICLVLTIFFLSHFLDIQPTNEIRPPFIFYLTPEYSTLSYSSQNKRQIHVS